MDFEDKLDVKVNLCVLVFGGQSVQDKIEVVFKHGCWHQVVNLTGGLIELF